MTAATESVTMLRISYLLRLVDENCGIRPDDNRVGDLHDLVDREVGRACVPADRLGARGLVDADRPNTSVRLGRHVAADPADVVAHPLPLDCRARSSVLQVACG